MNKIMNRFLYLKLELKRTLKLLPLLLTGAIALSLVIGAVAFCAGKLLSSSNQLNDKKTIVFADEDSNKITEMVVSSLKKSDSINTLFNIVEADADEADEMAKNDEAIVSIVIPKYFMAGLLIGESLPIRLYYSNTTSIYSLFITELSQAAQLSLKAAQSGVFTLYDFYIYNDKLKYAPEANTKLNIIYLKKALLRDNMFDPTTLDATGTMDIKTFYLSSGIMVILLLLGCVFILRMKETNPVIILKLKQHRIGTIFQTLTKIFCTFAALFLLFIIALASAFFICLFRKSNYTFYLPEMLVNGFAVCLCSAAIITFISSLVKSRFSAILLLFISVIASCFASGAFIPSILLPESVSSLGRYLPTTYLLNTTGMILEGDFAPKGLLLLLLYFIGFLVVTIFFSFISSIRLCRSKK